MQCYALPGGATSDLGGNPAKHISSGAAEVADGARKIVGQGRG
jgi:hypothetical protein